MNFIIFGGSGFIGSHFVDFVYKSFPESKVFNLDIEYSSHNGKSNHIFCDVRKKIKVDISIGKDDLIFNFAAIHRTPGHPDYDYFETNIKGAENVCAFAEEYDINTIVFTSSIAPYGASEDLKSENTLPTPNSPYGISKLVAENVHKTWQANDYQNRKLLIIRPGVVFGQGENGNYTRLYNAIAKGRFFYPGRKDTIKGCIYVKDLVQLSFDIITSYHNGVKVYNFAYYPAQTIKQITHQISVTTGIKEPKLLISGKLLKFAALIIGSLGGKKLGIHPDRVKKLMISTNICGKKVLNDGFNYKFGFENGIKDWYLDCNKKGLY